MRRDALVECKACDAKLPLVWHVQSRKTVHLQGLNVISCARVDTCDQRARDIANDRSNDAQRGR
jgi:hypothetical protein